MGSVLSQFPLHSAPLHQQAARFFGLSRPSRWSEAYHKQNRRWPSWQTDLVGCDQSLYAIILRHLRDLAGILSTSSVTGLP
jgi:hypothetical protein